MDPRVIRVMLAWLLEVCKIKKNMLIFNIFLHETHKKRVEGVRGYWSKITGFPKANFSTIYWKRNQLKTNRRNTGEWDYGVLKIKVKKSSRLVREIAGWTDGIFEKIVNIK